MELPAIRIESPGPPGSGNRGWSVLVRPLSIDRTSLVCLAGCTATFSLWTIQLQRGFSLDNLALFLLLPLGMFYFGRATLRLIGYQCAHVHPFPLTFLLGSIVAGLVLFALDFISPLSLRGNTLLLLAVSLLLQGIAPREYSTDVVPTQTGCTMLAVFLALTAATLWSRDRRPCQIVEGDEVVFQMHTDYFVHAHEVGQICADANLLRLGNASLSGRPLPLYHYVSYMYPAVVAVWTGQTGLESLVSFWTPFGVVLTGLAACALASAWWSDLSGLAALVGVLLLPDPSMYGLHMECYSFHWTNLAISGLAYGTATAAAALMLFSRAVQSTHWRLAGAALVLSLFNFLIKAHVFFIAAPVSLFYFQYYNEDWDRRTRIRFIGLTIVAMLFAALVADRLSIGPKILPLGPTRFHLSYYSFVIGMIQSDIARLVFYPFQPGDSVVWFAARLPFLVLGGTLGAFALVFPLLVAFSFRRKLWETVDAIPVLSVGAFLFCAFCLAPNTRGGTNDELWHRPYVWAYFAVTVWSCGKLAHLLQISRTGRNALIRGTIIAVCLALVCVPWIYGTPTHETVASRSDDSSEQKHRPGSRSTELTNRRIPSGLVACASYLRKQTNENDIVQGEVFKMPPILGGISQRRCYLGRIPFFWDKYLTYSPDRAEAHRRREVLTQMKKSQSLAELIRFVDETEICWYVAHPDDELSWPKDFLDAPSYQSAGYRVYDLRQISD